MTTDPYLRWQSRGKPRPDRRRRLGVSLHAESLEGRSLPATFLPAPADYAGTGRTDLGVLRFNDNFATVPQAQATFLVQPTPSASATQSYGVALGLSGIDVPTPADFDGDGKADPAVHGFLNNVYYGQNYGTATGFAGTMPFPEGAGRFAYIPTSGYYPPTTLNAVNGTFTAFPSKVVVVNLGGPGDLPAVGDYDGDGKADFAVYQPSKAQFLVYPSSTFQPSNDPRVNPGGLVVLPFGKVGDLPAPADYQGTGRTNFAVYEPDLGRFLVLPDGGGAGMSVALGGPGHVPVPADFEGVGRAGFAVYNQSRGEFAYLPAAGGAARTVSVGSPGDLPAVGQFAGSTRAGFATFTPTTGVYHVLPPDAVVAVDRALPDTDTIAVPRLDDFGIAEFATTLAQLNVARPDVLFLGDSITQRFSTVGAQVWARRISQFNAFNFGSVGDTTQNLLWRVQNGAVATQPKVIVLTVGTNDVFTYLRSAGEVADSIRTIISEIHARSPNSSILLNSVFPIPPEPSGDPGVGHLKYLFAWPTLSALDNVLIPALAPPIATRSTLSHPRGASSLNLVTQFNADPNEPNNLVGNPNLFVDSLHPNATGYEVWANNLVTPLRLLLNRPVVASDFDGDGKTDISVYGPSVRGFATRLSTSSRDVFIPYGIAGAGESLNATGDYDGDGKSDYAVYGPSVRGFAIHLSSTTADVFLPYGIAGDGQSLPAPGDYDGDGRTDLAVYGPSFGGFAIHDSKGNTDTFVRFGLPGAGQSLPAPGDYDGDGRTDLAVFMPLLGVFAYRPSTGGADVVVRFGTSGAGESIPAPGDYDGDGRTDLAVYIPDAGYFTARLSSGSADQTESFVAAAAGQAIPTPGDYDGDGKTDFAVYRPAARGFTIHSSGSKTNRFIPYGIAGAGQSLPSTSFAPATSARLNPPVPAGPDKIRPSTEPSRLAPDQV